VVSLKNSLCHWSVYGKTQFSAITDILQALDFTLSKGDAFKIADALYKYWEDGFPSINTLMNLVNEVGWFTGFLKRHIRYHSYYLTTVQETVKIEKITTTVYNRVMKKRNPWRP